MLEVIGHRISRAILCGWLGLSGRWRFHRGHARLDFLAAHATFQRLVDINWSSYVGHLFLGLIAAHQMRRREAVEELSIAYRLRPRRFRRSRLPLELKERVIWREGLRGQPGMSFENLDDAAWGQGPSAAPETRRKGPRPRPRSGAPVEVHERCMGRPVAHDFSSEEEYERFLRLPPIRAEEVSQVDLDALLDQLLQDH